MTIEIYTTLAIAIAVAVVAAAAAFVQWVNKKPDIFVFFSVFISAHWLWYGF